MAKIITQSWTALNVKNDDVFSARDAIEKAQSYADGFGNSIDVKEIYGKEYISKEDFDKII